MPDAPIDDLSLLQAGIETTAGTLVAATHRVYHEPGSVDFDPGLDIIERHYAGSLATGHGASVGLQHPTLKYRARVTYDQIVRELSMFLKGTLSGSGGSADKTWTGITPSDSADNLNRWSYQVGGVDTWPEEEKFSGCVGQELEITWNKNDPVMMSVNLLAMRNTQAAKTGSLTMPTTLVEVLGKSSRVYIDATTMGSTSWSRGISGSLKIGVQTQQRYGSDGNDFPNSVRVVGRRTLSANVKVEYDATTLRTAWRTPTLHKMRWEWVGPALGGTNYNLRFDLWGYWRAMPLGTDGGVKVLDAEFFPNYDATNTAEITAVVVNTLTAVP